MIAPTKFISPSTVIMVQEVYLCFKQFFNNIHSFRDVSRLDHNIIQEFMTYCTNFLDQCSCHFHKSRKCSSPKLTYFRSYSRNFIVFSDNEVKIHSITIPVFYCESCNHYHSLLPAPFLIPYEQFSIPFILAVLYDRFQNKMKIEDILDKYNLPQSTYYRWVRKYRIYYRIFIQLYNDVLHSFFIAAESSFFEMSSSMYYLTGSALFEKNFKLISNST